MAEPLTDLAERAYVALNDRDIDAFLELSDPEIEIVSLIAEAEGGVFRGHEGVREWWNTIVVGSLGGIRFEIDEIRQLDDEMLLVKLVASGEVAEVHVEQVMWQLIQIRDDRALWWQPFRTEAEALAGVAGRRSG